MSDRTELYIAQLTTTEGFRRVIRRYGLITPWLIMLTMMSGMLSAMLLGTIINVAIPDIMGAFGVGQDDAQWLATANLAAATVGMLLASWLVQNFGLRLTLSTTMLAFLASCVLGGAAPTLEVMIVARILQGLAAGIVTPLGMSVIFQVFPPGRQGLAMGISSLGGVLAPAIGPTVGGVLIDTFSWHYVFYLGVPFSMVCVPLALLFLPDREGPRPDHPLDWGGLVTLTVAITSLLIGLSNGQKEGWSSDYILACFAISVVFSGGFIYWERHTDHPLLDLQVFGYRQFLIMAIVCFVSGAGLYGSTYIVPLFLQLVQNLTPTDAGLAMMPAGFALALSMPLGGRLSDMFDHRWLMTIGTLGFALSFYLMTIADADTAIWQFALWLVIGRIAVALIMPVLNVGSLQALPATLIHQGSGTVNFMRQLGGAFGVNLLSVAMSQRAQFHLDALFATQRYDNATTMQTLTILQQELVRTGLAPVEKMYVAAGHLAAMLSQQATILSFRDGFWIITVAFLLTLVPIWFLGRTTRTAPATI